MVSTTPWTLNAFSRTFISRPSLSYPEMDISKTKPVYMIIHEAIANDARYTVEDHVCSDPDAESRAPMGPELPNGIFTLTKTLFAGCLHHR